MAALSEVDICNDALAHIGAKAEIQSLSTDTSTAARTCSRYYPRVRDEMLARRRWTFAERRVTLSEVAGYTPPDGWAYAHEAPGDMIEAREFWSGAPRATRDTHQEYQFFIRSVGTPPVILSNVAEPSLIYTARVTLTALFPALFAEALAWRLGERLAGSLADDADMVVRCAQFAEQKESQAWAQDLNGRRQIHPEVPSYIAKR